MPTVTIQLVDCPDGSFDLSIVSDVPWDAEKIMNGTAPQSHLLGATTVQMIRDHMKCGPMYQIPREGAKQ